MEKRKITLTAIILGVVLVALFGSTYAYFTSNNDPQNSAQAIIQTGSLSLILDDVDGITEEDKIDANHTSIVKYFSITNNGTQDAYAKLIFKGLTNTFVRDDLVYELEEVQSDKSSFSTPKIELSETVVPKSSSPSNQVLADSILIEKGTLSNNTVTPNTKYYKLTVKYKYSDTVNQNEDLGATLVSGFTIEEGTYQTRVLTTNGVEMRTNNNNINTTIAPNGSIQTTFILRNNTDTTQKVDVELTNITNTNANTTASLDKNGTVIVDNVTVPVGTNESIVLKSGLEVPSSDNSTYTITINNTDTNSSNISASVNANKYSSPVKCVDDSNNEIDCPATFAMGDRIRIGTEYFRYLRTTSTNKNLNDCGEKNNIACPDTEDGKIRMIAEKNLKAPSIEYIASPPQQADGKNPVKYSDNYDNKFSYETSRLKRYVESYAAHLNTTYFNGDNVIRANALTRFEAIELFGCSSAGDGGNCTNLPEWAKKEFWLMSVTPSKGLYFNGLSWNGNGLYFINYTWTLNTTYYTISSYYYDNYTYGVRPVIELDTSLL